MKIIYESVNVIYPCLFIIELVELEKMYLTKKYMPSLHVIIIISHLEREGRGCCNSYLLIFLYRYINVLFCIRL